MRVDPDLAPEERARRLAERRHGVVSRDELRAERLTRGQIEHLCRSPRWERLSPRVLMLRGAPRTTMAEVAAAVLDAGPGAVLSDLSAANRWGLSGCRLRPVTASRVSATRARPDLVVVRRVRCLPESWCTVLDGVPILRPELLAVRLFALQRPERAAVLVDRLWSMRLLSGPSVAHLLDEMGARGRNGIAGLRDYLDERGPGYVSPASNLESRVRKILGDAGIPVRSQVDSGAANWTGRVDFRHVTLPLIVEVQSEAYHTALADRMADRRRIEQLHRDGFTTVQVWDTTVWSDPGGVVSAVDDGVRRCRAVL